MNKGKSFMLKRCLYVTILLAGFCTPLLGQTATDSLLRERQNLVDVLDSARAGTMDSSALSLIRLLMASEDIVAMDNDLIGKYLSHEKARADSLQLQFNLQQTNALNNDTRISSMNTLILTAWGVTAVALFLFLIMLILYVKTLRMKNQVTLLHTEAEKTLAEYRKRIPEFQAENDFLKEKLEEKNPEKDYLKEKLKNYQDEMERIGADKRALLKDLQNILDRVKDL